MHWNFLNAICQLLEAKLSRSFLLDVIETCCFDDSVMDLVDHSRGIRKGNDNKWYRFEEKRFLFQEPILEWDIESTVEAAMFRTEKDIAMECESNINRNEAVSNCGSPKLAIEYSNCIVPPPNVNPFGSGTKNLSEKKPVPQSNEVVPVKESVQEVDRIINIKGKSEEIGLARFKALQDHPACLSVRKSSLRSSSYAPSSDPPIFTVSSSSDSSSESFNIKSCERCHVFERREYLLRSRNKVDEICIDCRRQELCSCKNGCSSCTKGRYNMLNLKKKLKEIN